MVSARLSRGEIAEAENATGDKEAPPEAIVDRTRCVD
jgi:hypothetical protein